MRTDKFKWITLGLIISVFTLFNFSCLNSKIESIIPTYVEEPESGQGKSVWNIEIASVENHSPLSTVFFFDDNNQWIGGVRCLYKTSDSGKTWEKIDLSISKDEAVKKISFIDLSKGWLVVQKNLPSSFDFMGNEFKILMTNDGGKNWREIYVEKGGVVTTVKFDGNNQIWLAGLKYKKNSPVCFDPLLLSYDIGNASWSNNEQLFESVLKENSYNIAGCLNMAIAGIDISDDKIVNVISSKREIYDEKDKDVWHLTFKAKAQVGSLGIRAFGLTSESRWFLESTDGQEGIGSELNIVSKNGEFENNIKSGFYFTDAVYISDEEFLVVGYEVESTLNKKTGKKQMLRNGVILQTFDNGKNFTEIYKNQTEKQISHLYKYNVNNVWALEAGGNLIKLTRPKTS